VSAALLLGRPAHTGAPTTIGVAIAPTSQDGLDQPAEVPMRFAAAGDIGTGGVEEAATAAAMAALEGDIEYEALLLLGDNIYEDGDPAKIQAAVFEPFAEVLDDGTEVLAVLGNHDVDGGFADAQVAALGMPGPWYAATFGDVRIVALDSNRPDDADQLAWLTETLAAATERWKIVILHHPPYSGGWHGSDLRVRNAFGPLFEEYGVQLVLAGHDHDYQRTEPINGVTYVVSGGAAQIRPARIADFSVVAWSTYHFLDIAVWNSHLDLRAVDQQLGVIDEVVIES
jgi:3',5'-cyclic AMP phosphodiesterase CpdA